jgi:hypothetical protein
LLRGGRRCRVGLGDLVFDVAAGGADVAPHEQVGQLTVAIGQGIEDAVMFGKGLSWPVGAAEYWMRYMRANWYSSPQRMRVRIWLPLAWMIL